MSNTTFAQEYARVQNNIEAAYDQAEEMGATIPTIKNSDNLVDTISTIPTGIDINGIIEKYRIAAGENISAGNFIEFINNIGNDTSIDDNIQLTSGDKILAILLEEDKVFIAHDKGGLYGVICTIEETNITTGTKTLITYTGNYSMSAILLSVNKIFIAHKSTMNNNYLEGIICTVSGSTIIPATNTILINESYTGQAVSVTLLSENKVYISHYCNGYAAGIVCTISGTTITTGTDTILSGTTGNVHGTSVTLIAENKVFIIYSPSDYLDGIICTISGTTITTGTAISISTDNYSGYAMSIITLSENKVLITHSYSSGYLLYGIVCTVSDTTVTKGTSTKLSSTGYTGWAIATTALSNKEVFIAHSYSNNYLLYGITCTINGTNITKGTDTKISSQTGSGYIISSTIPLVSAKKVFIAHAYDMTNYYLYGIIEWYKLIKNISTINNINGIAAESGTTGDTIDIYVPNI